MREHLCLNAFYEQEKRKEHDLQGFKYFKTLSQMPERLHNEGCQRDRAGNRILHMDQYMTLLLQCMFSPISKSLRSILINNQQILRLSYFNIFQDIFQLFKLN